MRVELTYPGVPYITNTSSPMYVPRQPSGRYHAVYATFAVAAPGDNYRLTLGGFDG